MLCSTNRSVTIISDQSVYLGLAKLDLATLTINFHGSGMQSN